ncbi:MAG: ABC transporter ATP-binding protein [Clostridiaceae bacterium]|nr:ABC transporter ATP-binding protein [Clostridiaceae bacterium]
MSAEKAPKGTIKKVLEYVSKYRFLIILSLMLTVINVSLTLYIPLLFGSAIDLIIGEGLVDFAAIRPELGKIAILSVICAGALLAMNLLNNRITFNTARDIRNDIFRKINVLPLEYIDRHPTGETVSRMVTDVEQFSDGLLMGFTQLFSGVLTIAGTLILMLKINWKIALVVVCLTPLSLFVARFIAKHTYKFFNDQSKVRAEQTGVINEVTGNLKVVKAFNREKAELKRFGEINERLEKVSLKAIFYSSLTNPVTRFVNALVYAAVAFVGATDVISPYTALTVGMLTSVLSYANQYTKPFNEISGVIAEFQNALACAARIFDILAQTPEKPDSDNAKTLKNTEGNIEVISVNFSYDKNREFMKDLNFSAKKGQKIAIVGPTGCGKTTLINLLMRFYDVDKGSITVDGTDIRNITRRSLRASFGMVLQDTWLKPGTVRENIAFGKPDATDEEIIEAAKRAHSYSFIKRLPNGLDTVIGEDSGSLSEGQKQLLCITRVMLSLPSVLILDEATSSIDVNTEIRINKAFDELMHGRTSFIVAHRLSTILDADKILVMDKGRIVETGTHKELLEKGGFYANLFNSSFC